MDSESVDDPEEIEARRHFKNFNWENINKQSISISILTTHAPAWELILEKNYGKPIDKSEKGNGKKFTVLSYHGQSQPAGTVYVTIWNKTKQPRSTILIQAENCNMQMNIDFLNEKLPEMFEEVIKVETFSIVGDDYAQDTATIGKKKSSRKTMLRCDKCQVKATPMGMKMHLKVAHTGKSKKPGLREVKKTYLKTLPEDLSLLEEVIDIDKEITLEEDVEKPEENPSTINCDWLPCNYNSDNRQKVIDHIDDIHFNKKPRNNTVRQVELISCNQCEFDSETESAFITHTKKYHETDALLYNCNLCGFVTNLNHSLQDHKNKEHEEQSPEITEAEPDLLQSAVVCGVCAEWFSTENGCMEHMSSHTSRFKCSLCTNSVISSLELERHVDTEHVEQSIKREKSLEKIIIRNLAM